MRRPDRLICWCNLRNRTENAATSGAGIPGLYAPSRRTIQQRLVCWTCREASSLGIAESTSVTFIFVVLMDTNYVQHMCDHVHTVLYIHHYLLFFKNQSSPSFQLQTIYLTDKSKNIFGISKETPNRKGKKIK